MADHPQPPQAGPQTGVKGIKADAQRQTETDLDLQKLTIDERNRYLESKSFQAQTHDEEYQDRAEEQRERLNGKVLDGDGKEKDIDDGQHEGEGDDEDDDQAFRRQWRERRLQEMKQQQQRNHDGLNHSTEDRDGQDETNDDWKLEKNRLREVGPEGFLKAVEGSGWTAVLLYEPDLPRCQPFIQAFVDLSSSNPSNPMVSFLKARATSLSFSLLPESQSQPSTIPEEREDDHDGDDHDDDARDGATQSQPQSRSDPDVLPSVLVYKAGELKESFIRIDFDVQVGEGVDGGLADELGRLFRRKGLPIAK
ncbi:hypothetical protein FFLO_03986 [Filobasidium floriforme]|uniref:Phosducin thioredoxin-like domain-containing protein n=1 Tax=Filobasidium floriforme TaxID=5210 RepID=A0A8K0NSN6_9TREE|nr:uncharacterized protein HD553DRAFT_326181 [Filobasidium floriforme]KAG7531979.1 hypothetical protein FFLO_03986 [Filobasidium floriforme]KAH8080242.1 hypothetical protein HD553DRAFT_326181 [Filobasidium floriforme]